jgi:hypothetical protein
MNPPPPPLPLTLLLFYSSTLPLFTFSIVQHIPGSVLEDTFLSQGHTQERDSGAFSTKEEKERRNANMITINISTHIQSPIILVRTYILSYFHTYTRTHTHSLSLSRIRKSQDLVRFVCQCALCVCVCVCVCMYVQVGWDYEYLPNCETS